MKAFRRSVMFCAIFLSIVVISLLHTSCGDEKGGPAPKTDFNRIDLTQVKASGEVGRRLNLTLRNNLLVLDVEKDFLRPFRNRRPKEKVERFDRFTGLGMLINAAVLFAKTTGDPDAIERKKFLVGETIKTQSPSGYIGAFEEEPNGVQLWSEYSFHEAAYITYALSEDYRHFGNEASLQAARKLADYLMASWPSRPPGNYFTTLGATEAYFSLFEITGEKKYLQFASEEPMGIKFEISPAPLATWVQDLHPPRPLSPEEIAEQPSNVRKFDYVHMYRTFATAIMQLRLNRIEPRETLLVTSRRLIDGMTRPVKRAMLITGVTGEHEAWHENQEGRGRIAENCATVYELWFLDELLRLDGDLRYGDIMERAMYNALFGSQDPKGRQVCYFTPFSGKREYFGRDTYCCPNNFRRGIAALPGLIYYQSKDGVAINLYAASTADLKLSDGTLLHVEQRTEYPTSERVEITLSPAKPASFALRLRIPRWCENAKITVGGSTTHAKPGQAFWGITRKWLSGDQVTLEFPAVPRWVKGKELQEGHVALLRGPVLYGLNPGHNPLVKDLELREISLDPNSLEGPFPDDLFRPNGTALRIRGWSPGKSTGQPPDLNLTLSEFVDPGVEEVYFRLPDLNRAVNEELTRQEAAPNL